MKTAEVVQEGIFILVHHNINFKKNLHGLTATHGDENRLGWGPIFIPDIQEEPNRRLNLVILNLCYGALVISQNFLIINLFSIGER